MSSTATIIKPWLSAEEVKELTGKQRRHTQLRELQALGLMEAVHYRTDGSFIVLRHLVEQAKQGKTGKAPGLTLHRLKHAS
jgi:hypothetical protein